MFVFCLDLCHGKYDGRDGRTRRRRCRGDVVDKYRRVRAVPCDLVIIASGCLNDEIPRRDMLSVISDERHLRIAVGDVITVLL